MGHGIVSYIPSSILQYEYPQTLDEYMRDTTFFMEYRYLLLYFIPGIDLEMFIHMLPERRRDILFRKWTIADILGVEIDSHDDKLLLENEIPNDLPDNDDLQWDDTPLQVDNNQENHNAIVPMQVVTCNNTQQEEENKIEIDP